MNKKQEYRMCVGASSILMIFVILSLTTLGVLAFASGRADLSLTARRQAQVEVYYGAAAEAQRVIARIDEALLKARAHPVTYEAQVRALADDTVSVSDDRMIAFVVPVGQTQQIEVALRATDLDSDRRYTLLRHALVNISDWTPEEVSYIAIDDKERGIN